MFKEINFSDYLKLHLNKIYDTNNSPFFRCVAYFSEYYLGYIFYSIIYDRIEIDYIYVDDKYRNNNIGTKLMNYVEKIARDNLCKNISLEVNINNAAAINLYHKCGFINVAIRKMYYNGVDALLMVKELGD